MIGLKNLMKRYFKLNFNAKLKVLVLGSGGQLGKELKYNLTKNVSTIFFDKEKLDITNYDY